MSNPRPKAAQHFALNFHQTIQPLLITHRNLSVSIAWCPSHCGIPGNERADQLAKEATDLERQTPFSVSQTNARRRAKRTTLKLWQTDWINSPKVGRYAIANQIPPSLKPTPHFTSLKNKREVFGRVTQCRTGHSYTGEFRRSFLPLSPDPITCPCDELEETIETRNHILRDCTRYSQHRNILEKASRSLTLSVLLGSKEGIAALAEFISKSGAFTREGTFKTPTLPPTYDNEPNAPIEREHNFEQDDRG